MGTLFNTPSKRFLKLARARLAKFDPSQPRDKDGKWTAGGVARAVVGTALGVGALAALPGVSNTFRVAGRFTDAGYTARRWVRTGQLRHPASAAFLSPYQEVARAIRRRTNPSAAANESLAEIGRHTIARQMQVNNWPGRLAGYGRKPLTRGGRIFRR